MCPRFSISAAALAASQKASWIPCGHLLYGVARYQNSLLTRLTPCLLVSFRCGLTSPAAKSAEQIDRERLIFHLSPAPGGGGGVGRQCGERVVYEALDARQPNDNARVAHMRFAGRGAAVAP